MFLSAQGYGFLTLTFFKELSKVEHSGNCLAAWWLETPHTFIAKGMNSITGQGTKIPQAALSLN